MTVASPLDVIGGLPQHAVGYAVEQLEVFPVDPGSKRPMAAVVHGAPSQYSATTDVDLVAEWWDRWPTALIGHRLPADQIIIDIDPRHGGAATWQALREHFGLAPATTRIHMSGRGDGGGHVWFARPAGKLTISQLDDWAETHGTGHAITDKTGAPTGHWVCGLDLLHRDHRYTILPPSPHPETGQPYRWHQWSDVEDLPSELIALLVDQRPPPPPFTPKAYEGDSIVEWYTAKHSLSELLHRHGWTLRSHGSGDADGARWQHPSATSPISATVRHGCLFVYCVDESTEALTKRGWLNVDQLRPDDEFLTIDPVDREIRWSLATLNVFPAEPREMVRMQHKQFDALVTPNHRWLMEGAGQRGGHVSTKPTHHFRTTEELITGSTGRIVAGGGNYDAGPGEHMNEFVELVGWVVTEGTYATVGNGIQVVQSESHNPQHVRRLQQLAVHFRALGATVTEYQRDTEHGDIRTFYFGRGIAARVRAVAPGKALTPEFLLSLGNGQLELLYRTLMDADGHVSATGTEKWTQQDEGRLDGFAMLCALLGIRTHARPSSGGCQTVTAYKADHAHTENMRWTTEKYDGRVWCPTTPTGTWMARHNGFTSWTGNSPNTVFPVTAPGDPNGITTFTAYAVLEHGGDQSAAARAARELKDGPRPGKPPIRLSAPTPAPPAPAAVEEDEIDGDDQAEVVATQNDGPPPWILPEEFWAARPVLGHIRTAAHSRIRSADLVLHGVLARLSAYTAHSYELPPLAGAVGSLNYFTIAVGPSGAGKSSGSSIADELLERPSRVEDKPLGSGEGLAENYMGNVTEEDEAGKKRTVRRQVLHNVFVYGDEGAALTEMMQRKGATLPEALRRAWTGGALGQSNATTERTRVIPAGNYRLGLLIGFQPEIAAQLMADAIAGTPQRFTFSWAGDPNIPEPNAIPDWPGELVIPRPAAGDLTAHTVTRGGFRRVQLSVAEEIRTEVVADAVQRARGEAVGAALDSHEPLHLLKLSGLLALLEGRLHIRTADWELARIMWATSCAVRAGVEHAVAAERERQDTARIDFHARREGAAEAARSGAQDRVLRIAMQVARWVHENPVDDGYTAAQLGRRIAGRERHLLDPVIDRALAREWLVEAEFGRYTASAEWPGA